MSTEKELRTKMWLDDEKTIINTNFLRDVIVFKNNGDGKEPQIGRIYHFNIGGKENIMNDKHKPSDSNNGKFSICVELLLTNGTWGRANINGEYSRWWFGDNKRKECYVVYGDKEYAKAFENADFTKLSYERLEACAKAELRKEREDRK